MSSSGISNTGSESFNSGSSATSPPRRQPLVETDITASHSWDEAVLASGETDSSHQLFHLAMHPHPYEPVEGLHFPGSSDEDAKYRNHERRLLEHRLENGDTLVASLDAHAISFTAQGSAVVGNARPPRAQLDVNGMNHLYRDATRYLKISQVLKRDMDEEILCRGPAGRLKLVSRQFAMFNHL
jgi:hypothetical protein